MAQAVRKRLLTGIALYPDEIVAAIFEVSQSPQALASGAPASEPGYRASMALLQTQPAVLANLREHPGSTAAIGEMARRDIDGCWATIDQIRRESGWTRPAAVVAVPAPVAVPAVTVVAPAVPASAVVVAGTVAPAGAVVVAGPGAAHAGGGVVVTTSDGTVKAGTAGGTVVATPSGTVVAVGHAGTSSVNLEQGTASSSQVVGGVTSTGRGAVAARSGSTTWDENSFQHSGQGTVQTASGAGATYTRESSGEKTDSGASKSSSTQVEMNNGEVVTVDRSTTVTKGEDGVQVDRSTTASSTSGASYEHASTATHEAGKTDVTRTTQATGAQGESVSAQSQMHARSGEGYAGVVRGGSASTSTGQAAGFVQGAGAVNTGNGVVTARGGVGGAGAVPQTQTYARRGQAAGSPESFSMRGMDSSALASSMERATAQNRKVFSENERGAPGGGRSGPSGGSRGGRRK